jgi:myosin heavy subunit
MIGGTVDGEEGLDGDGEPVDVNNTSVAMASNLARPVGTKKAKRMEKDNNSLARLMSKQQNNIKELIMSNQQVAFAMEDKNKLTEKKNRLTENRDRVNKRQIQRSNLWQKLKFYEKRGNEFKVDQLMEQIEALDQEEEISVSTEELVKKLPRTINLDRRHTETPSNSNASGLFVNAADASVDSPISE